MGYEFVVEEEAEDLTIPEGLDVRATLSDIKKRTMEWTDKKTGERKSKDRLEWWWDVQSPEKFASRRVKGECDFKIQWGDTFYQWAAALLDRTIPRGMAIDTDDLLGVTALVQVRHRKIPDGRTFEEVVDVKPAGAATFDDAPPF